MKSEANSKATGIRLQKAIAGAGIASRRHAERLIVEGRVRVNGRVVSELGTRVDGSSDVVEVDGRRLPASQSMPREVWALYKPRGCVTTLHDPQGRSTVRDFFPKSARRLFPVGRLDFDAEGLILLTNDGEFAHQVAHPSHSVSKTYLVKLKGIIPQAALQQLAAQPIIDGRRRRPVKARLLHTVNDKSWCEVELQEGVNHHIKKLFDRAGYRVLKIKRYRIGSVALEALQPGESRLLGRAEIAKLVGQ